MNNKQEIERILRKRLKAIADREKRKQRFANARIIPSHCPADSPAEQTRAARCPCCHKLAGMELKHTGNIHRVMGCDIDSGGCGVTWPYYNEVNQMQCKTKGQQGKRDFHPDK